MLGVTAGASDATAFERLGHVFASVVTGNLLLFAIGGIRHNGWAVLFSGCAVIGYVLGVLLASPHRRHGTAEEHRVWPPAATVALAFECVLMLAFTVGWEATGGRPDRAMQAVLVSIVAVVMGVQSAAVRRLGRFSTTYLTGTVTDLLEGVALREWSMEQLRGLAIVIAAIAGAAVAAVVIDDAPRCLPVVPSVPLALVVIASGRLLGAKSVGSASPGVSMGKC